MRMHKGETACFGRAQWNAEKDDTQLSKTHSYHLYTHGEYCLRGELGSVVADYAKHLEREIPNRVSMIDWIGLASWAYTSTLPPGMGSWRGVRGAAAIMS